MVPTLDYVFFQIFVHFLQLFNWSRKSLTIKFPEHFVQNSKVASGFENCIKMSLHVEKLTLKSLLLKIFKILFKFSLKSVYIKYAP